MSRISRLRSMTLTLSRLSSDFCCVGDSSSSATSRSKLRLVPGGDELLGLAFADVPVGIDVAAVLPLGADDLGPCGHREVRQLDERVLGGPAGVVAGIDGDEEGLLGRRGELDQAVSTRAGGVGHRAAV